MNGTATIIDGTDEDHEAAQVLKRSASNQDVALEMLGTTITISKNNPSPVSSISSVRSSRTDMESVAYTDPRDSRKAQFKSLLRRSRMQRLQMIRQRGGLGQGAMMPQFHRKQEKLGGQLGGDQSIVKMANIRRKTRTRSQSSTEGHNAKPESATSAQRWPVVETTESADSELDDERETGNGVNATSRSWGKVSIPPVSALDEELQGFPALYDKAQPDSSRDVSPAGSRAAVADVVHTAMIVNTEEEPHLCRCIADVESDVDLENAGQEQQKNSRRGYLSMSGKHDEISRQSSSGVRLSHPTTPFRESNSDAAVRRRGSLSGHGEGSGIAPKTRLRFRRARAGKSVQPGAANGVKVGSSPTVSNVRPQSCLQMSLEALRGRASASTDLPRGNRENLCGGDLEGLVMPKIDDEDRRRGLPEREAGCEVAKQSEHSTFGSRSTTQTHDRQGAEAVPNGAGKGGEKHDGISAPRQPFHAKEEAWRAGIEIAGKRVYSTGTRKPSDNDVEREEAERRLVDKLESFPPPRSLTTSPERKRFFHEATVGSAEGTLCCDRVTPVAAMAGKVEAKSGSSGRRSAPVRGSIPTEAFGGNRRHDSVAKPSTTPEEPLTGEDSKPSPVSRARRSIGPTVAVWKWGEGISGLDCVRLEGIADTSDGVDEWNFQRQCDKAAPRPPEASTTPLEQSSSALCTYAVPPRPEETPAAVAPVLSLACGYGHAALLLSDGGLATIGWGDRRQVEYGRCGGIHEVDPVAVHFVECKGEEAPHSHDGRQRVCCSLENNLPGENPHEIETPLLQGAGFEKYPNRMKVSRGWNKGSPSPPREAGLMRVDVRGVACGRSHTAAFDWSGVLWTWGAGADGALGHGDRQPSNVPRRVSTLADAVVEGVACGTGHTLALGLQKSTSVGDGSRRGLSPAGAPVVVYRWGFIHFNKSVIVPGRHRSRGSPPPTDACRAMQLSERQPEGRTLLRPAIAESLAGLKIVQISCGARHSCAVDGAGRCYTSGCNLSGQLGRRPPTFETSALACHPNQRRVHIATSRGFEDEGPCEACGSGGSFDGCSVLRDARSLSGPNSGNGGTVDVLHRPGGVDGDLEHEGEGGDGFGRVSLGERQDERVFAGYTSVACGGSHTLVLTSKRELWSWGDNHRGQLGHGDFMGRSTPTLVSKVQDVRSIAAGDKTSAATTVAGVVLLWGCNSKGRLGLNLGDDVTPTPTVSPLLSGLGVLQVGLGGTYGLCLLARKLENTVHLPMMAGDCKSERDLGSTATLSRSPECSAVETRLPDVFLGSKPPASQEVGGLSPTTRNPRSADSGGDRGAYRGRNGSEMGGIPGGFNPRSAANGGDPEDASRSGDAMLEGRKDGNTWSSTVIAEGNTPGLALVTKISPRRSEPTVRAQCRKKERGMYRRSCFPYLKELSAPKRHRRGSKSGYISGGYKGLLTVPDFGKWNRANHIVAGNRGPALMTIAQSPGSTLPVVIVSSHLSQMRNESSLRQAHADAERMNAGKDAPGASGDTRRPVRPSGKSRSIKGRDRFTRKSHQASAESSVVRATANDRRLERDPEGRLPDDYVFVFDNSSAPRRVADATSNAGPGPGSGPGSSREEPTVGDALTAWDVVTGNTHQQSPLSLKRSVRESPGVRNGRERSKVGDRVTIEATGVVPTGRLSLSPTDDLSMASGIASVRCSVRTAGSKSRTRNNTDLLALDNLHSHPLAQDSTLAVFSRDRGNGDRFAPSSLPVRANAGPTGGGTKRFLWDNVEETGPGASSSPLMAKAVPDSPNEIYSAGSDGDLNTTASLSGHARSTPSMSTRGVIEDRNSAPRRNEKIDASGSGQPRSREETIKATSSLSRSGVASACGNEIRASPAALAIPAQDRSTVEGSFFSRLWVESPPRDMNSTTNQVRENRSAAMHREDAIEEDLGGALGSVLDVPVQDLSTVVGSFFSHLWVKNPSGKGSSIANPVGENSSGKLQRESNAKRNFAAAAAGADATGATATAVGAAEKQLLLEAGVSQASRRDTTFRQSLATLSPRRSSTGRISLGNPVVDKRKFALTRESETTSHGRGGSCTLCPVEGSSEGTESSSAKRDRRSDGEKEKSKKKRENNKKTIAWIAAHLAFWR